MVALRDRQNRVDQLRHCTLVGFGRGGKVADAGRLVVIRAPGHGELGPLDDVHPSLRRAAIRPLLHDGQLAEQRVEVFVGDLAC